MSNKLTADAYSDSLSSSNPSYIPLLLLLRPLIHAPCPPSTTSTCPYFPSLPPCIPLITWETPQKFQTSLQATLNISAIENSAADENRQTLFKNMQKVKMDKNG